MSKDLLAKHYDEVVSKTWNYAHRCETERDHTTNAVLGLVGEAGEVADAHKKLWFHAPKDRLHDIKLELGDVLYYQSKLHNIYGVTMEELLAMNKAKLFERYEVISI